MNGETLDPGVTIVDASPAIRVAAFLSDMVVLVIPTAIIIAAVFPEEVAVAAAGGAVVLDPFSAEALLASGAIVTVLILYFAGMETSRWRGTLGKMLFTLRVANDDLSQTTSRQAALRNLMRLPWAIPVLGMGVFLVDGLLVLVRRQRTGDLVAKTRVVRTIGYWTRRTGSDEGES